MPRVLFVCKGNICRSPTAEAVVADAVQRLGLQAHWQIDSAGTHGYHIGEPPDHRSVRAAAVRGIAMAHLRARLIQANDFDAFDQILVMDQHNLRDVLAICPDRFISKVRLFLSDSDCGLNAEVPDPYYAGAAAFETVLDLCMRGARGLLSRYAGVAKNLMATAEG